MDENKYGEFKRIKVNQYLLSRKMFRPVRNIVNSQQEEQHSLPLEAV